MKVEVIRSQRRHKTVEAKIVDGVMRLSIPAAMSLEDEAHWVATMRTKLEKRRIADAVELTDRARVLANRYALPEPTEIVWSNRQRLRWGSCTPSQGRIRISSTVAGFPRWVLDYVIVHELVHLVEPNHSSSFWTMVNRYPRSERARGYLIAKADIGA